MEYFERKIKSYHISHQCNNYNILHFTIGLIELLDSAKSFIPKEYWKTTPITLKATAGLRLLPKEEGDAILEVARAVISYMMKL